MKKIMLILIFFPIIIYGQTKDTIRYSIGILDIYYIFDQLPSRNECDFLEVQLLLIYPPYEIGSCASDVILNEVIYVSYTEYAYVLKEKDALSIPFTHYIGYFDGVPYKHFTDINLKDKNINKKI